MWLNPIELEQNLNNKSEFVNTQNGIILAVDWFAYTICKGTHY